MKRLLLSIALLFITMSAAAQTNGGANSQNEGFYLGGSLLGASWNMPDLDLESERGGGIGLRAGYNFSTNFGLFASVDGSRIDPEQGEDYGLAHVDLGVEGIFGNTSNSVRPFGRLSLLGMAAHSNDPDGDVTIRGGGVGLGAGLYFFPSSNFSLELSYTHSWINLNEVEVGSVSVEVDEDAESARLMIGGAFHF